MDYLDYGMESNFVENLKKYTFLVWEGRGLNQYKEIIFQIIEIFLGVGKLLQNPQISIRQPPLMNCFVKNISYLIALKKSCQILNLR